MFLNQRKQYVLSFNLFLDLINLRERASAFIISEIRNENKRYFIKPNRPLVYVL